LTTAEKKHQTKNLMGIDACNEHGEHVVGVRATVGANGDDHVKGVTRACTRQNTAKACLHGEIMRIADAECTCTVFIAGITIEEKLCHASSINRQVR
jgi:hypothetical protein